MFYENPNFNPPNLINFKINYDKNQDSTKTPPYRSPYFKSVYEGIALEFHVLNACNLNCAGCNRFAPLQDSFDPIEIEDWTNQLLEIQKNIPNVKQLTIMGGEPTLHPKLLEICEITRKLFPSIKLYIVSNGTNINSIKQNLFEYEQLNVKFLFCSYPTYTKYDEIKEISSIARWTSTRLYSTSILIDEKGEEDNIHNFFSCYKFTLPNFVLKNYKLYICPIGANIDLYCAKAHCTIPEVEGIDYLDVRKIQNNLDLIQTFCFTPKNTCKFCKFKSNKWIYHKSHKDIIEYNSLLSEMYFNDYDRYEKIILGDKEYFLKALNLDYNPAIVDYNFNMPQQNIDELRFGKGKLDLILTYCDAVRADSLYWLKQDLLNQTIIKDCIIYIVSAKASYDKEVIDIFKDTPNLNCIFLRNNTTDLWEAKNKGRICSHNDFQYYLNPYDSLPDPQYFEKLYNTAISAYEK